MKPALLVARAVSAGVEDRVVRAERVAGATKPALEEGLVAHQVREAGRAPAGPRERPGRLLCCGPYREPMSSRGREVLLELFWTIRGVATLPVGKGRKPVSTS